MINDIEPLTEYQHIADPIAARVTFPIACNEEHMRAWIHALRTTEIKQQGGSLRYLTPGGTLQCCAQGIAMETAIDTGGVNLIRSRSGYKLEGYEYFIAGLMPPAMFQWLGLPDEYGRDDVYVQASDGSAIGVSVLNDQRGYTFAQIAAALENTYLPQDAAEHAAQNETENDK